MIGRRLSKKASNDDFLMNSTSSKNEFQDVLKDIQRMRGRNRGSLAPTQLAPT